MNTKQITVEQYTEINVRKFICSAPIKHSNNSLECSYISFREGNVKAAFSGCT